MMPKTALLNIYENVTEKPLYVHYKHLIWKSKYELELNKHDCLFGIQKDNLANSLAQILG